MLKKINNFFTSEDDTQVEESDRSEVVESFKPREKKQKVSVSEDLGFMKNSNVVLVEPLVFADSKDIIDDIKKNKVVILNLSKLDVQTVDRLLDFISGGIYAIEAKLKTIGDEIYLCVPKGVEVEGEFTEGVY